MSDSLDFKECSICAAKSGNPELCPSCLHNRAAIQFLATDDLTFKVDKLQPKPGDVLLVRLDPAFDAASEVRAIAEVMYSIVPNGASWVILNRDHSIEVLDDEKLAAIGLQKIKTNA